MNSSQSTVLEVQDLCKNFGTVQAVRGLSFTVQKGEVFGFLGPNGAGKTTAMRIVTCFLPASAGSIRVGGLDIIQNDLEVRKKIGYLPESTPLYADMQVEEYLTFVGNIRGLQGGKLKSRMDEMVQVCGLATMVKRPIGYLSKGYRQRVGLAQAMLHSPDLLILDEPTSGLDPNQIVEIRQLIKSIGKEKTVIYCSHILSEVSATCDRILIINNGQAVAIGTPNELTSRSSQSNRYMVRLRGERSAFESKLKGIPGVSGVTVKPAAGEYSQVDVLSDIHDDLGEKIFRCAVDNNFGLAELKRETVSLEDVFTQLTRGQ